MSVVLNECSTQSGVLKLRSSSKRVALKNFGKFTGKHLCRSLLSKKVAKPATSLKKTLRNRYFPVNFAKFLRASYLQNTSGDCFCKFI